MPPPAGRLHQPRTGPAPANAGRHRLPRRALLAPEAERAALPGPTANAGRRWPAQDVPPPVPSAIRDACQQLGPGSFVVAGGN